MNLPFLQSAPGDAVVILEGEFDTSVERMYRVWTNSEELMKWFGPSPGALLAVDVTLRIGRRVCFEFVPNENRRVAIEGTYLEIEPNKKIVFSWSHIVVRHDGEQRATPLSKVTVTFQKSGSQTRVLLRHEGIVQQEGRDGVGHGWTGAMSHLQEYLSR